MPQGKPYPECQEWVAAVRDTLLADPPEVLVVSGLRDVFLYTVDDLERAIEDNRRSRREAATEADEELARSVEAEAPDLEASAADAPKHGFFVRLYTGTGAFEVIGRRKLWYAVSGIIVLIALAAIVISIVTWTLDLTGLVYTCPYCRVQRSVIGLLGLVMLWPDPRAWPVPAHRSARRPVMSSIRRSVDDSTRGMVSPAASSGSRKWLVWNSQPSSPGRTTAIPRPSGATSTGSWSSAGSSTRTPPRNIAPPPR